MTQKNLILIHRGPEYARDFDEIAAKVSALDKSITIYHLPSQLNAELPMAMWLHPSLTISLDTDFAIDIRRGPVIRSRRIDKLDQAEIFRKAGVGTPAALPFRFGMMLDPIMFGELVVLKTRDLGQTSGGDAVHLYRRKRLVGMKPGDFPRSHPIHHSRNGYIVQRFVDTGELPGFIRVQTFLGKAIYSWNTTLKTARAPLTASDAELEASKIANQGRVPKTRDMIRDEEAIAMAETIHAALPDIPMLAVDIVRDVATRRIFALECNPGGHTWHFSSDNGANIRLGLGDAQRNGEAEAHRIARDVLIRQFGAFDIVAERLVDATRRLAA